MIKERRFFMTPAEKIIAAVRAKGSDARDLRDATHEACPALDAGVQGKWERERIHRKLVRTHRDKLLRCEFRARGVEALMCDDFGVHYDLEKWAGITFMETIKTVGARLPYKDVIKQIEHHHKLPETRAMVDMIKLLAKGAT